MKKANCLIMALVMLITSMSFAEGAAWQSGDYTGEAAGFGGNVSVALTIEDGKITNVTATAYNAAANGEAEDSFGGTADTMDSIDDGPYYALKMRPCMITSLIGVTVDGNCHVLREDGTQIPNLFAAGDMILGNMFHIYNSGHGVGNALYSGNMSAQTAKAEM